MNFEVAPTFDESSALALALTFVNADTFAWEDDSLEYYLQLDSVPEMSTYFPQGELVLALMENKPYVLDTNYRLAWKYRIVAKTPRYDKYVYVDAHNGLILKEVTAGAHGDFNHISQSCYR